MSQTGQVPKQQQILAMEEEIRLRMENSFRKCER